MSILVLGWGKSNLFDLPGCRCVSHNASRLRPADGGAQYIVQFIGTFGRSSTLLCANSQGSFGKGLPEDAQDEPDEKAFDFEIVARAGRKDIKDIVPWLVLVGFEDINMSLVEED